MKRVTLTLAGASTPMSRSSTTSMTRCLGRRRKTAMNASLSGRGMEANEARWPRLHTMMPLGAIPFVTVKFHGCKIRF